MQCHSVELIQKLYFQKSRPGHSTYLSSFLTLQYVHLNEVQSSLILKSLVQQLYIWKNSFVINIQKDDT